MKRNISENPRIAFVSVSSASPWDIHTLSSSGLGGTEATALRIAHGLAERFSVYFAQESREDGQSQAIENVNYCNLDQLESIKPDVVVLIANFKRAVEIAKRYKPRKTYLWLHNVPRWKLGLYLKAYQQSAIDLIGVSDWHARLIKKAITKFRIFDWHSHHPVPRVHRIYNPVPDEFEPNTTSRNLNKLIFTSSPHKGLEEVVKKFKAIHNEFPDLKLYVANPGYNQLSGDIEDDIYYLGQLPHNEVIKHLRESFCVFYPQTSHMETFGLVFAEANAVGTPVIAHNFGAADEVLTNTQQAMDCSKLENIFARLHTWQKEYPKIIGNPEFKLGKVLENWKSLLSQIEK